MALPVWLYKRCPMCETDGAKPLPFTLSLTQINADATPTFGIFVQGGNVSFDPAANRIFVRFKDSDKVTPGSTSVAVRTQ